VSLTGKQKAAMLLMSLDATTAAELLQGVKPDLVQEVAMELAYLDAAGYGRDKQSTQVARQFCNSLEADEGFQRKSFLKAMLKSTVGERQAEHIQTQIRNLLTARDPFTRIGFVDSRTLASVLKREHPRAAAAVLSGLPAKKSSDVLGLLGEGIRLSVVSRMTTCENMTAQVKARMAETVCERLEAASTVGCAKKNFAHPTASQSGCGEAATPRFERFLRKLAVILRNLGGELRDCLLGAPAVLLRETKQRGQRKDDQAGLRPAPIGAAAMHPEDPCAKTTFAHPTYVGRLVRGQASASVGCAKTNFAHHMSNSTACAKNEFCTPYELRTAPARGVPPGGTTILWEDIPQVADRLLQRALSRVDERKLALALVGADYSLVQKIMSNITERAAAVLDEEASRVSSGGNKDVEEAREEIVHVLREMNERD